MKHLELEEKRFSDVWGITGVSLIGVLLHFYPGDFNKALETYPDELRYIVLPEAYLMVRVWIFGVSIIPAWMIGREVGLDKKSLLSDIFDGNMARYDAFNDFYGGDFILANPFTICLCVAHQ